MSKKQLLFAGVIILLLVIFVSYWVGRQASFVPGGDVGRNVTPTPSGSQLSRPSAEQGNIVVSAPQANTVVSLPISVTGQARVFENQFMYRVRNEGDGKILLEQSAYAKSPDTGQYGPFQISITSLPAAAEKNVLLEAFDYSAKDGTEIDTVRVPLVVDTTNTVLVTAYFMDQQAPAGQECTSTIPVERRIKKTPSIANAALRELLKGPMVVEKESGATTNIPVGVTLQKLTITDGIAHADFSRQLEEQVGGSCRVTAIRQQITDTLLQFPSVKKVIISIDGRTADILQP